MAPAAVFLLALAALLFLIPRVLLGDTQLAALATLIVLILLFPAPALAAPVYMVIGVAGVSLVLIRVVKRDGNFREALQLPSSFTSIVNTVSAMVLVAIALQAAFQAYRIATESEAIAESANAVVLPDARDRVAGDLPDIVHIVLDGYSRADVLQETYGYDNTPFLDALRRRGFRISDQAQTPYNQTLFAMSSIFSLAPVNDLMATPIGDHSKNEMRRVLARSVRQGMVTNALRRLGYELFSAPSTYLPLQLPDIVGTDGGTHPANRLQMPGSYIFSHDLLSQSPVLRFLLKPLIGARFDAPAINFRLLNDLPNRRLSPRQDRPRFVYQHILAPHPPFNIAADGSARTVVGLHEGLSDGSHLIFDDNAKRARYREGYIEKLKYVNDAVLTHIDRLKETLPGPLIIILHGDHGGGMYFDQDDKAKTCVNERFSPLFAIFATDKSVLSEFTPDFNIVNTYRAIFRAVLKSDLPDVPSRSTFVSWELDDAAEIDPQELLNSCPNAHRNWIADRPSSQSTDPSSNPISR